MTTLDDLTVKEHIKLLRLATVAAWLLTVLLLYLSSALPLFDSSPTTVLVPQSFRESLAFLTLRWDAFHFMHIAQEGYSYEYEWAFLPAIAKTMTWSTATLQQIGILPDGSPPSIASLLFPTALLSALVSSTTSLYFLTLHHFGSTSVAYLTALLSLLPSSPTTLRFSVYTEPFFTYLSYKGMLCCARSQWTKATLFFTLAAAFRSNGIVLAGFLIWGLLVEPTLHDRRVSAMASLKAALATITICLPFASHQYSAYLQFCDTRAVSPEDMAVWCSATIPSVYNYVQAKYWNSGFLKYWTMSQLPNILLASPILGSTIFFAFSHLRACTIPLLLRHPLVSRFHALNSLRPFCVPVASVFFEPSITPHVLHALLMCGILLFSAHTQIALRQAASMPITYWAAARLVADYPRIGEAWVTWSAVYGAISIVLWATFLPPA